MLDRPVNDGECFQAEEIEFHQTCAFDPFHIELGRGKAGAGVAVERRQLRERPVRDYNARGMGRGIAIKALELQGGIQNLGHRLVIVSRRLQARLDLDGLGQGDRIGGIVGNHLGQTVHQAQGKLHHPTHVAQNSAGLQAAEGDDLGDTVVTVAPLHIGDHLFPPLLAEVDVEVGHGDPFRIQEPLEQQAEPQGIDAGNQQ